MKLVYLVFAIFSLCHALTEEDIKNKIVLATFKCNDKMGIEISELVPLLSYKMPTSNKVKCVLACAYKETNTMTPDGLFNIEYMHTLAEQLKNGDEKRLSNALKIIEACKYVNDVDVPDPKEGCERATLIFKCGIENVPKYGFKL